MTLETYVDLINGLNNQVDNLKRALLREFHNYPVWITRDKPSERTLAFLFCKIDGDYELTLDDETVLIHLADIKQLRIHDHRLVIVL